jgi:valyl-tRNA synthetase
MPESATALVGESGTLHIPMAGLIDKDTEMKRLDKEIGKAENELSAKQKKLANPNYVEKAPADVVGKERDRVAELESALSRLQEEKQRIAAM